MSLQQWELCCQAKTSNTRHRPIGIGVQGLADAFILMRYPFESPEARELNRHIFETIYYAAVKMSCQLAKEEGPYETYEGSPVSKGVSHNQGYGWVTSDLLYYDVVAGITVFDTFPNIRTIAHIQTTSAAKKEIPMIWKIKMLFSLFVWLFVWLCWLKCSLSFCSCKVTFLWLQCAFWSFTACQFVFIHFNKLGTIFAAAAHLKGKQKIYWE